MIRSLVLRPLRCLHTNAGISRPPLSNSRSFSFTPNRRLPRQFSRFERRHTLSSHSEPESSIPSFREEVARTGGVKSFSEQVEEPGINKQILCFFIGSIVVFGVAARATNEDTLAWTKKLSETSILWRVRVPTNEEMRRARHQELGETLQAGLTTLRTWVSGWGNTLSSMCQWTYVQVAQPLLQTTEGRRVCWTIGALNGFIWVAWQFPGLQHAMMRSFAHSPLSGLSYTLLTSVFSHKSLLHLIFNNMALASFGSSAAAYLTSTSPEQMRESTVKYHLLAFFISAGLFSGLASHLVAARITYPRLVAGFGSPATAAAAASSAAKEAPRILPSLGASGAIYGTVTLTALAYPDSEVRLIFPPTPSFPIEYGVGALVALDCIGVLRGWRMFDHVAHLSGAAFGAWYYVYGPRMWESARRVALGGLPRDLTVPAGDV